jgi:hypothetical protein
VTLEAPVLPLQTLPFSFFHGNVGADEVVLCEGAKRLEFRVAERGVVGTVEIQLEIGEWGYQEGLAASIRAAIAYLPCV